MKNKFFTFFMLVILLISFCSLSVASELTGFGSTEGTCGPDLTWELCEGTLTISGFGPMDDYTSQEGMPWVVLKDTIHDVILPQGITTIGNYAFATCGSLERINIPEGITTIGAWAFREDRCLLNVVLPSTLTRIGDSAFSYCTSITEMHIPDNTELSDYALCGCESLTDLVLPASMTYIPRSLLDSCYSLTALNIPSGVTGTDWHVFAYLTKMTSISFSANMTSIGADAFDGCTALTDVYFDGTKAQADQIQISSGNDIIFDVRWHCSDGTFDGVGPTSGSCGPNLTWELEDGILTISGTGEMNFTSIPWETNKKKITKVILPDGITSVTGFNECINLKTINLPEGITTIQGEAFRMCSQLENVKLPSTLIYIGTGAFMNCTSLTEFIMPDSVTNLDSYALCNCSSLTNVHLSEKLAICDWSALTTCSSLETIDIPDGITGISWGFMSSCNSLKAIRLPSSVQSINAGAFSGDNLLEEVFFDGTKAQADAINIGEDNGNLLFALWHCTDGDFQGIGPTEGQCGDSSTWKLENGTMYINGTGNMWDYYDSNIPWESHKKEITKAVIADGITRIGSYAFYNCISLTDISIPDSVTEIGAWTFRMCSALESIQLPDKVQYLGDDAFAYCTSLKSISLPDSITYMDWYTFYGCSALEAVKWPAGMTYIPEVCFGECYGLNGFTIPSTVTQIRNRAFDFCTHLQAISFSNSVTMIGESAFGNNYELRTIYFQGTRQEADAITIGLGNESLQQAMNHCTLVNERHKEADEYCHWSVSETGEEEMIYGVHFDLDHDGFCDDPYCGHAVSQCPGHQYQVFQINENEHGLECSICHCREYKMHGSCDPNAMICAVCGRDREQCNAWNSDHVISDAYIIDEDYHRQICTVCGQNIYKEFHQVTCTEPNHCTVCGCTVSEDHIMNLTHNAAEYSNEYADDYCHWCVCSDCGEIILQSPHYDYNWDGICDDYNCGHAVKKCKEHHYVTTVEMDDMHQVECTVCHYALIGQHGSCDPDATECGICGRERDLCTEWMEGHNSDGTSRVDARNHFEVCSICGEVVIRDVHCAYCKQPEKCIGCGATVTDDHIVIGYFIHDSAYQNEYTADDYCHWCICENCGQDTGFSPHYDNDGDMICDFCNHEMTPCPGHQYIARSEDGDFYYVHGLECAICHDYREGIHGNCDMDATECAVCGMKRELCTSWTTRHMTVGEFTTDTHTHTAICASCGEEFTEAHWATCWTPDYCIGCMHNTYDDGISIEDFIHNYQQCPEFADEYYHWTQCIDCQDSRDICPHYDKNGDGLCDEPKCRHTMPADPVKLSITVTVDGNQNCKIGDTLVVSTVSSLEPYESLECSFMSSDNRVAIVSENGEIACCGSGIAIITVIPKDNRYMQEQIAIVCGDTNAIATPSDLICIDDEAFRNSDARYVVLNNGIEKIGDFAFADCDSLYGIVIPASVTEISENAFAGSNMVVIITTENSYACQYAERKALPVIVNK